MDGLADTPWHADQCQQHVHPIKPAERKRTTRLKCEIAMILPYPKRACSRLCANRIRIGAVGNCCAVASAGRSAHARSTLLAYHHNAVQRRAANIFGRYFLLWFGLV